MTYSRRPPASRSWMSIDRSGTTEEGAARDWDRGERDDSERLTAAEGEHPDRTGTLVDGLQLELERQALPALGNGERSPVLALENEAAARLDEDVEGLAGRDVQ